MKHRHILGVTKAGHPEAIQQGSSKDLNANFNRPNFRREHDLNTNAL
jgi:hypothetical protein